MKKAEKKSKIGVMDVILVFIGIALVIFTSVMIWLFYTVGSVPDVLITCFFSLLGGECGVMGWIKNVKERNKEREWQIEDEKKEIKRQKKEKTI